MGKGFVNVSGGGGSEEKLKAHLENKNNPHGVTAEQVGAAKADHTHTAAQVGARPNTWTPKLADVAFLGNQPISAVANDTTANWANLGSTADDTTDRWCRIGSGYAWYCAAGLLNDQPAQYGFLLNYVNGSDVFQIWNTQSNGPMYTRSGNASGWGRSWTKLIDSSSIGSQTVNKAKYASGQSGTGAVLRNEALYTSDTTPTANGQINWTYG